MKKYLYVITTKDEYELPMFVADTIRELSEMTGIKRKTLTHYFTLGRKGYYKILTDEKAYL